MDPAAPAGASSTRLPPVIRVGLPFVALAAMVVFILVAPSKGQMTSLGPELFVEVLRKAGHVLGYATFAVIVALALGAVRVRGGPGILRAATARWVLGAAWAVTALVAVADEVHQAFVPDRTASPLDVALDVSAAAAGLAILVLWIRRRSRGGAGESRPA